MKTYYIYDMQTNEKELEKEWKYWNGEYKKKFGEYYPNMPTCLSGEEQIDDMKKCIETGIPAQNEGMSRKVCKFLG